MRHAAESTAAIAPCFDKACQEGLSITCFLQNRAVRLIALHRSRRQLYHPPDGSALRLGR